MRAVDSISPGFATPQTSSRSFESDAARAFSTRLRAHEQTPEGKARATAEQLVAVSLVEPTLKLLRESNDAAAPFAPGEAEKAFGPLLDQAIAERVVRASNFGIVDRLASDLLKHGQAAARAAGVNTHA